MRYANVSLSLVYVLLQIYEVLSLNNRNRKRGYKLNKENTETNYLHKKYCNKNCLKYILSIQFHKTLCLTLAITVKIGNFVHDLLALSQSRLHLDGFGGIGTGLGETGIGLDDTEVSLGDTTR